MTDDRRAELLAKKAELLSALDDVKQFEALKKRREEIAKKYGYGWDGPRSAIEMKISDIDREVDYESYLTSFATEYIATGTGHPDIIEICRRFVDSRNAAVEKP